MLKHAESFIQVATSTWAPEDVKEAPEAPLYTSPSSFCVAPSTGFE